MSFASRKNAPSGKTMQAESYWNVPHLNAPHQRCTDKREHERYLTRNFKMRDPDFTSTEQMDSLNIDLKITGKKQMKLKVTV